MQRRPVCPSVPPLRRSHKRALSESPPRSSRHSPGPNFTGGVTHAPQIETENLQDNPTYHLNPPTKRYSKMALAKAQEGCRGVYYVHFPVLVPSCPLRESSSFSAERPLRWETLEKEQTSNGPAVEQCPRKLSGASSFDVTLLRWASSRRIRAGPNAGALGRQKVKPFTPVARRSRRRGVKRMKEEQRLCRHTCSSSHCLSFPKDRRGTTDGRQTTKRHCCDTRAIFYRFASLGRPTSLPR